MVSGRTGIALICGAVAYASLAPIEGQTPDQARPVFRSNVELVEVDVSVRDADGRPIRALTRADFTVRDGGRVQPVATFIEVSHDYPEATARVTAPGVVMDVADNFGPANERLVVIVVDDMVPRDMQESERRLARQVVERLTGGASMALLLTSGTDNVEVTRDAARLFAVIDRVGTKASQAPRVPQQQGAVTSRGTPAEEFGLGGGGCHWQMLEHAADSVAGGDTRRKALILISPFCGVWLAQKGPVVPLFDAAPSDLRAIDAVNALRAAKVAVYALDPRGALSYDVAHFPSPDLVSRSDDSGQRAFVDRGYVRSDDPVFISQRALRIFTDATGGFAVTNTDDLRGGIDRVMDDLDHYYLLGFYPADAASKGYRPIDVTVNRPGVTLRYRRGYELGRRASRPKSTDSLVSLSTGALPDPDLPLRLFATPAPASAKSFREIVALEVRAPRDALAGALQDEISARILAIDLKRSKVVRNLKVTRAVDLGSALARQGAVVAYTVVSSVDLSPGTYQLRVSATSARLERSGSVYLTVDVPAVSRDAVALGGIMLGYASSGPGPKNAPNVPFDPTLDRVFGPSDRLRVFAGLRRAAKEPVAAIVELRDGAARAIHTIEIADVPADTPGIDVTLGLTDVPPGPYTLCVGVGSNGASVYRETAIAVRR
jgi:VWFA-related protein